jgi:hypothetical protein
VDRIDLARKGVHTLMCSIEGEECVDNLSEMLTTFQEAQH